MADAPAPPSGVRITYRQQYRRCGKAACTRCAAGGQGHGPYWYAVWWEEGRTRTRYLGKARPNVPDGHPSAAPDAPAGAKQQSGTRLRVLTLGGFSIWRDAAHVPVTAWARHKTGALFKWLLAAPRYRLPRDQVVELLWPEAFPATGVGNLRVLVYRLRRALGEPPEAATSVVTYDGEMLALASDSSEGIWVDAAAFTTAAARALAGQTRTACYTALALYTGDYLPDDTYEEWAVGPREELRQTRQRLLLHLAGLCRAAGEEEETMSYLHMVLASDRCHEDAALALMRLHVAADRPAGALRVYQQLAEALREELDLAPGKAARALAARLQRAQHPAPPLPPRPANRTNLPATLTSFIGRGRELAALRALFGPGHRAGSASCGLLTLVGPGGVGKTRLALALADELLDVYPAGVWLADLSILAASGEADDRTVPGTVAAALSLQEEPIRPLLTTLIEHIGTQRLLLVLDNCEHVLPACAAMTTALLMACPELRILATSRETLGVSGEQPWWVPTLSLPEPGVSLERLPEAEAARLFLARARLQRPTLDLTEEDVPAVAAICRQLDGLPLALELAAARVGVLSIAEIAARLRESLQLLTGGSRGASGRQRTLRATLDWSYGLLSADEQQLFRRLAVFAGGSTLEAIQTICVDFPGTAPAWSSGETLGSSVRAAAVGGGSENDSTADAWMVLDALTGLVRKSLVMADDLESVGRYRLLETVRQFALEKLYAAAETQSVQERHRAYFLALAEASEPALSGSAQEAAINQLEREHDNLRAALSWTREQGDTMLGLRFVCALAPFWRLRTNVSEGRQWLESMLARSEEAHGDGEARIALAAARARTLRMAGVFAFEQGDYAQATAHGERSLRLLRDLGDTRGIAMVLNNLGNVADQRGDYTRSQVLYDESLKLLRTVGDRMLVMRSLNNHGLTARKRGDYSRARSLLNECLSLAREIGDSEGVARACTNLSTLAYFQGEYGEAAALAEESLVRQRALGNKTGMASALRNLGNVSFEQRDYPPAWERHTESLSLGREVGDKSTVATALGNLGAVAWRQGDRALAGTYYEESLVLYQEMGVKDGVASILAHLAGLWCERGDQARALRLYRQSLDLYWELRDKRGVAVCLEGLAVVAREREQFERAASLYGAAAALRTAIGAPLPPVDREQHARVLAATRIVLGEYTFAAVWAAGQAMPLEAAMDSVMTAAATS